MAESKVRISQGVRWQTQNELSLVVNCADLYNIIFLQQSYVL